MPSKELRLSTGLPNEALVIDTLLSPHFPDFVYFTSLLLSSFLFALVWL
jgi:hypothetical protein